MQTNLTENSVFQDSPEYPFQAIARQNHAYGGNYSAKPSQTKTNAQKSNGSAKSESSDTQESPPQTDRSKNSSILPYIPRKRQERSGLLVDYLYLPAEKEAGDHLDFLILGENRLGVLLVDVTGKMPEDNSPVLKTVLKSNSTGLSAAATLRFLDQRLAEEYTGDFSITAFYAIFDQNKRLMNFASAGHLPMLVHRESDKKTFLLNTKGAPFSRESSQVEHAQNGVANTAMIESEKIALKQNDLLVLYSDGLLSVRGDRGEYFGRQRFLDFITKYGELDPTSFVAELRNVLQRFTNGRATNDDITVIVLKNVLRDFEEQPADLKDCELTERFLTTEQEQHILEILRETPQLGTQEIVAQLSENSTSDLTRPQIEKYLDQNGRWLQPWPPRNGGFHPAGFDSSESDGLLKGGELQKELLSAFPIRQLLNKRYEFRGGSARLNMALQYYNNCDYKKSLEIFSQIRNSIKNSATIHCFFGNLYLLLEQPEIARKEFVEALKLDPRCNHALLANSYLAILEDDYQMAIESLATAVRLHRDQTEFHEFLAKLIGAVERRDNRNEWLV